MGQQLHITKENLAAFQRWLLELPQKGTTNDFIKNLYFDLPLAAILKDAPTLSPIAQEVLAYVIANERGYKDQVADAKTLLDLAKIQPIMLGKTYAISGNSRHGSMFSALLHAMEQRTFEQNIPAIYVMMQFSFVPPSSVGTGEITKTSAQNTKMLNDIFENSDSASSRDQFRANAYSLISNLDMGKLLNFEGASPAFRKRINAANFNGWRNEKYEKIAKINPELIDEQILHDFINTPTPKLKDTSGAKTQKEKNTNILPISYTKPRDALIRMVENTKLYGHPNTLTQRFKALKERMIKSNNWPTNNSNYDTLARDVYLKMIQRDIIDGRAGDLSAEDLKLAVQSDKDGFYIRRIPDNMLPDLMPYMNKTQHSIISARNLKNAEINIRSKYLPSPDKQAMIEKLSDIVASEEETRNNLDKELAQFDQDYQVVKSAGSDVQNANTIYTDMGHIQAAYKRIRGHLKDGVPNTQEAHLTQSEMERAIYAYLTGASDTMIATPAQKSLPIFGRGAEKERRERLEREIQDFNKELTTIRNKTTNALIKLWSQYRGTILNPDSLRTAGDILNKTQNIANEKHSEFQYHHRTRADIESDQRKYAAKKDSLNRTKTDFEAQQNKLHDMSRRHMGRDQMGEITPITDDMTAEEKRKVRAKNHQVLTDKLAMRKNKKPATNLAEMLANADMDR